MSGPGAIAFTDIVGFTEFTATEGDARALQVLDEQRRIVDALLPPAGRVVKELGDGLLVWIDGALDAIRFGQDVQRALRAEASARSVPLWVRMGLHWGDPAHRGTDLIGHDVNTAARIADQAGPGETLVSEVLVRQRGVDDAGVHLHPIGPVRMKGLPDALWLYRLT